MSEPSLPVVDAAIVVYSDITCPWSHIAVHRLVEARRRLGLDSTLGIDHRAFPLELVENAPTSKERLDDLVPTCSALAPEAGWRPPSGPWTFPVSSLPGLEAVQAAKAQHPESSVALDLELRRAVFERWACISVHAVVLEIAAGVEGLDVDALWAEIRSGRPRADVWHHFAFVESSDVVSVSPTFVLPDGSAHADPGVEMHLEDAGADRVRAVVDHDDAGAMDRLLQRAAAVRTAD